MSERYSVREEPRSRKQLSCAECHRLKLKCDRQVPCANCVRRECADLCPDSVRIKKRQVTSEEEWADGRRAEGEDGVSELRDRLSAIEELLVRMGRRSRSPRRRRRDRDEREERGRRRSTSVSRSSTPSPRWGYDSQEEQERGGRSDRQARTSEHLDRHARPPDREPERDRRRDKGKGGEDQRPSPRRLSPRRGRERGARDEERHDSGASGRDPRDLRHSRDDREGLELRHDRQSSGAGPSGQRPFLGRASPPPDESYGTLVIDPSGRSKWLGPTAGTEWLKNQEISDGASSSHSATPPASPPAHGFFPFSAGPAPVENVAFQLPPSHEAAILLDAYYTNYAWNHDVAPRRYVQPIHDRLYSTATGTPDPTRRVHPQQLALLFIIFAMGALHNPGLPAHDPSAERYLAAARSCLAKGDFIGHNTIPGLQAVVIMAHYHLETEKGRNGDSAWPLWGLAMRLVTAMGLHRDGERWNLPADVVEERRHVFWECHTIDVFQANCFSRPSSLRPEYIDTAFPSHEGPRGQKSFRTLKFELCRISGAVLDQAMDVRPTAYSAITSLYDRLCAFERQIPFRLRCRTALLALPSVHADSESATRASPAVDAQDLHLTFQQFTLALNVSECILFLQRPYFVKALQEAPQDPTRSAYGKSYLAVVERCNALIEVVAGLHELYPTVTARHWFFWYHLFTAAVCIGTMIIKNSANPLANFALGQVDHALALYSSVLREHSTPSLVQNHQWLLRLRQRALSRLEAERGGEQASEPGVSGETPQDTAIDVELLGWRTRLIARARHARHRANSLTSHPSVGSAAPMPMSFLPPISPADAAPPAPVDLVLQQHFAAPPLPTETSTSTDLFLHQFWDPTTLLEARNAPSLASANWWDFDSHLAGLDPGSWPQS